MSKEPELTEALMEYDAFTDINFNPKKGYNCQARSLSKYLALVENGVDMENLLSSPSIFVQTLFRTNSYYFAVVK